MIDHINNIKKILENNKEGFEYEKIKDIYEKTYGIKLDIKKPKKNLKNDFIIEDINKCEWRIKNKNIENKQDLEEDNIFINKLNKTSFLLGENENKYYLNIYEPFSCLISGVQGSGKSYTTNKILEGCMLETNKKCTTLICHYDTNPDIICESSTLYLENNKMIILTSPSNFFNRKKMYQNKLKHIKNNINIMPLLFDFKTLTIKMLKILMNIKITDNQLYMQGIINVLRKNCKINNKKINNIHDFEKEIKKELNLDKQQQGPLVQRLELLKSFLIDSDENKELLKYFKINNIDNIFKEGNLVILDLTDDLIDCSDANNIFRLLIDIFKSNNLGISKLLIFDEAHKYLTNQEDYLNKDIIDIIRMQRHYGIRTIVSTQNPCIINKEIIELSNFIILHRFSSPRWFEYINNIYNIKNEILINNIKINTFKCLLRIKNGNCILICPQNNLFVNIKIKTRKSYDLGSSITL